MIRGSPCQKHQKSQFFTLYWLLIERFVFLLSATDQHPCSWWRFKSLHHKFLTVSIICINNFEASETFSVTHQHRVNFSNSPHFPALPVAAFCLCQYQYRLFQSYSLMRLVIFTQRGDWTAIAGSVMVGGRIPRLSSEADKSLIQPFVSAPCF